VSYVVGSSSPGKEPEWSGKGIVEVFAMSKGELHPPALFTSSRTSCENGLKAAVVFLVNNTAIGN
jgi:hypothetical protein